MLFTPQRDPGKRWFSPRDQVLGALSQAGMWGRASPSCSSSPGEGNLCPVPMLQLWLAQKRAESPMCPYGFCTIVTVSCLDLTRTHRAEGEAPRVSVILC